MKTITIKKTYNGYVSIRDYIIKQLIKDWKGLIIRYKYQTMTLTPEQLAQYEQISNRIFYSQYKGNNRMYTLVDFRWIPDKEKI